MNPTSAKGQATAIAAYALDVLSGYRLRLHWCVDLLRDVGPDADELSDPTNPFKKTTKWGGYLQRLRAALDGQESDNAKCLLALTLRHTLVTTGQRVQTVFYIPYFVSLAYLCRANPPVGVWRLCVLPDEYGWRDAQPGQGYFKGDLLPDSFWYDGIPF